MICPNCETENTNEAEFCINCNKSLLNKSRTNTDTNQQKFEINESTLSTEGRDQSEFSAIDKTSISGNEPADQIKTKVHDHLKATEKESDHSPESEKPVVSSGLNIAIIIGTIIFPIIGIAMGYTYYRKNHPDAKKAGKNWLILGIIIFLANILLVNSIK
jgi:hypothetical protein